MSEKVLQPGATISLDLEKIMERTGKGKIKIKAKNKSRYALQALLVTLLGLTVVAFATFDYQNIDFAEHPDRVSGTGTDKRYPHQCFVPALSDILSGDSFDHHRRILCVFLLTALCQKHRKLPYGKWHQKLHCSGACGADSSVGIDLCRICRTWLCGSSSRFDFP